MGNKYTRNTPRDKPDARDGDRKDRTAANVLSRPRYFSPATARGVRQTEEIKTAADKSRTGLHLDELSSFTDRTFLFFSNSNRRTVSNRKHTFATTICRYL